MTLSEDDNPLPLNFPALVLDPTTESLLGTQLRASCSHGHFRSSSTLVSGDFLPQLGLLVSPTHPPQGPSTVSLAAVHWLARDGLHLPGFPIVE